MMKLIITSDQVKIRTFLEKISRKKYTEILEENGFNTLRSLGNYTNQDRGLTRIKLVEIIKDGKEVSFILDSADKEISKLIRRNILVFICIMIVILGTSLFY